MKRLFLALLLVNSIFTSDIDDDDKEHEKEHEKFVQKIKKENDLRAGSEYTWKEHISKDDLYRVLQDDNTKNTKVTVQTSTEMHKPQQQSWDSSNTKENVTTKHGTTYRKEKNMFGKWFVKKKKALSEHMRLFFKKMRRVTTKSAAEIEVERLEKELIDLGGDLDELKEEEEEYARWKNMTVLQKMRQRLKEFWADFTEEYWVKEYDKISKNFYKRLIEERAKEPREHSNHTIFVFNSTDNDTENFIFLNFPWQEDYTNQ
uniref:Uncharacterized protein n=1 Tax=Cacopsylla melanoneura TaxID=428564 RepID=A0A8D8QY68_9HEMI